MNDETTLLADPKKDAFKQVWDAANTVLEDPEKALLAKAAGKTPG